MLFERDESGKGVGERVGFIFGYFAFTTILFFVLYLTGKISASWSYFHVMGITFVITLAGIYLKRILK